jgi:Transposase DDE domain
MLRQRNQGITVKDTYGFLTAVYDGDIHAKRIESLANATMGVISSGSMAVNTIGHGLALAKGKNTKHAIKQVDRMLSNAGIDIDEFFEHWVPYMVGARPYIRAAMDWTDFDADGQSSLVISLLTKHGRATPLIWLTANKNTLKHHRNGYEYSILRRFHDCLPDGVKAMIIADRGFGDQKLYQVLDEELNFDYLIRFRGNIAVTSADGETRTAAQWVGKGGRACTLRQALVTADEYPVGTVVCVQDPDMKDAWCLATNTTREKTKDLKTYYGKRWSIEPGFRDTKDLHFGMGMSTARVSTPERRDRLWLLNALAVTLLTLLGAAGESLGYDRMLKSNTSKRRTHSLFRQGSMLYELMVTMPQERLLPLMERYNAMLLEIPVYNAIYGVV